MQELNGRKRENGGTNPVGIDVAQAIDFGGIIHPVLMYGFV